MQPKTVKITRVHEDVGEVLKEAVRDAGLRGKRMVFVKPNLSHPEYVPGVVTSPALMRELVGFLRDGAEEVVVGESNGFNYPCWSAFEKTGLEKAVKQAGGTVINLSEDKVVKVKLSGNGTLENLFLPKTVLDADAVVDAALMKTHEFAVYSGAIKNLFGCVSSNRRIYLHPYLPEVFYWLYAIFKPHLTVMDARTGIEGNGPTKGKPVKMDLMLTGNDALALDIIATRIMGLNWRQTYLSYIATKTGLREEAIKVEGLQVNEVKRRFELPRIDLPVKAQMEIYKHEFLTKLLFCSLDVVKLFQKITVAYRGEPIEVG
ncbi:DUF362 domain-containing protein [Candidatus Bathyarchaeota archaeon A05DMB-2]|jgi:uncharacterized protein (DUF362 family)|nr:DUF362 domain-containing protein [Candidatus Bathyarchaeota archaeon A05DMB-2]